MSQYPLGQPCSKSDLTSFHQTLLPRGWTFSRWASWMGSIQDLNHGSTQKWRRLPEPRNLLSPPKWPLADIGQDSGHPAVEEGQAPLCSFRGSSTQTNQCSSGELTSSSLKNEEWGQRDGLAGKGACGSA